ncbi:MAG: sensor histidine kinase, partial [Ktedonobacteraceae bacterium]
MEFDGQKQHHSPFPQSKLSIKLILSHLLVALGSLLVFMLVVSFAIQSYFVNSQYRLIYAQSLYAAKSYGKIYLQIGSSWDHFRPILGQGEDPSLLIVVDQSARVEIQLTPSYLFLSRVEESLIQQSMTKALAGETVTGYLQDDAPQAFTGYYACLPLTVHNQIIGALLFAHPEIYPQGFSPNSFLTDVSMVMLFSGIIIAIIVAFSSLFFVHRLTHPLVLMKRTVDKLSAGNYAERIPGPLPQDELGQLAHSFNNMARQIEEDIDALQRQEQYRREITANIAHDLSTPLAAIRGFSEALADGVLQDEQARADAYAVIIRESERLSLLTKDIQQLSSLESGRITFDYAPVDLAILVKETVEVIALQCSEANITIQNNIEPYDKLFIHADSHRIIQVLLNLFDNARHHTPAGETITIDSAHKNGLVTLWIKDTGAGIAPTDLPHIFDRFYRADPARTYTTGTGGNGLG